MNGNKLWRNIKRLQLNNGGFSLVEVLVAVLVLAILSVTLISGFASSARTSMKARRMQAATDLAQNTAEYYSAQSLNKLEEAAKASASDDLTVKKKSNGIEVFEFKEEGNNGDAFNVLVVLDPTQYTELNQYETPVLSNIFSNTNNYWMSEVTRFDEKALLDLQTRTIPTLAKSDITKKATVELVLKDGASDSNTILYEYRLKISYTTNYNGSNYTYSQTVGSYSGLFSIAVENAPGIYLVYTPYDTTTEYCKDEIEINCICDELTVYRNWHQTGANTHEIPVYLVLQNLLTPDHKDVDLKPVNVKVTNNDANDMLHLMTNSKALSNQIYVNAKKWGALTSDLSTTSAKTNVYAMDVYISQNDFDWSLNEAGKFTIVDNYYTSFSMTTTKVETNLQPE